MTTLSNIELIFSLIVLSISYIVASVISGVVQTIAASRLGDSTPQEAGYLSLNPFTHLRPSSFILFILYYYLTGTAISWPCLVPFNPFNTQNSRLINLVLIYLVEAISCIFLSIIALAITVLIYGIHSILLISQNLSLSFALSIFPGCSSFSIVCALFLISFIFINIFMAALSLIFNGFRFALVLGLDRGYSYVDYADYLIFFGPLIVIFFFAEPIRAILLKIIIWSTCHIAHLFGAL